MQTNDEKIKEEMYTICNKETHDIEIFTELNQNDKGKDGYLEILKFIDDIKENQFCGHMHERSLSFYYFINELKVYNTKNLMTHFQLNTHSTSPLPPDRFNSLYSNLK